MINPLNCRTKTYGDKMGDEIGESKGRRSFSPVVPEKTIREEANSDYELEIESIVKEYPDPKEREIVYKRFIKSEMTERRIVTKKYERARDAWRDSTNREECYEKVLRIISVRSKLENFVDKNYPLRINSKTSETVYGKPDSSYCDALNEMLVSQDVRFTQDVFIVMIRNRLDDRNITPAVFMKFARWLYNQMSDKTCHKMAQFSPPLPKFDDDGAIKEMLKAVEIDEDDPAVICIQIILQPLNLPPIVTGTTP